MKVLVKVEVDRLTRSVLFIAEAKDGKRHVQGKGPTRAEAIEQLMGKVRRHRALDELESEYPQEVELEI